MLRVVICEDDPIIAADLAMSVEDAGHSVCDTFDSGRAALESGRKIQADVALIDLKLADGDTGAQVAKMFADAGTRVMVLSGREGVVPDLCDISHTFVSKPLTPALVRALLSPHSDGRPEAA